jgi:hypothetical protein
LREGVRAGTQLRQRDKAKANITHGDDAEAQEPPQHGELKAATEQRCGRECAYSAPQRDKAKATVTHGDDAKARQSP